LAAKGTATAISIAQETQGTAHQCIGSPAEPGGSCRIRKNIILFWCRRPRTFYVLTWPVYENMNYPESKSEIPILYL